ncbi:MAG: hypothetical protein KY459_00810 [Acidobacteria bacterium]|nr:hypothetical protein [Acidobacteriota bacterium]
MSHRTRSALLIFAMGFLSGAWFFNGGGQNQNVNFDLARAVVEHRSVRVDDFRDNTVDLSYSNGHYYSNKPPGISLLAAPSYLLSRLVTRRLDLSPTLRLTLDQYVATALVCAISLGLIGVVLFLTGLEWGVEPRWAALVAVSTMLATPLLPYGTMLFAHVPNALTTLGALYYATRSRPSPILSGVCAGMGACLNYLSIPAALVPLYFLLRGDDRARRTVRFLAATLPFALLMMAYHWYAFGSPFTTAISSTSVEFITPGAPLGVLHTPSIAALWGLLGSKYRGLFFLAPFLVVAVAGLWKMRTRPFVVGSAATIALFLAFFSAFNGWHGGYTYGPRYILPVVPLIAAGLFAIRKRIPRLVVLALLAWSFPINMLATAVDPQVPEVLEDPVFDYIVPTFLTGVPPLISDAPWLHDFFIGSVGVNRLTVAERQIYRKHEPGSPETDWAAFNLGEPFFGVGSRVSLLPLLVVLAILLLTLDRSVRRLGQIDSASQATTP